MLDFELYTPTKLVFGDKSTTNVGDYLKGKYSNVLIHYGSERVVNSGLIKRISSSLESNGISFTILGGVIPNPEIELVRTGVKLAKEKKIDLIIAVGGGSVLDSAKAIAMGYYLEEDVWDVYLRKVGVTKVLPVVTVLTIPAAGSEMSNSTVISDPISKQKLGFNSDLIRPIISFIDCSQFVTLPYVQFQAGVSDMLSHIFERFFSPTRDVELTTRLAAATIKTIVNNSKKIVLKYDDVNAWKEVGFASSIAHNGLLGAGRAQDWACHRISHFLTSNYGSTHGIALSVLTYHWIILASRTNLPKLLPLLKILLEGTRYKATTFKEAFKFFEDYYDALKLPKYLKEIGIENDSLFADIAKDIIASTPSGYIGGFIQLKENDILNLLKESL